MAFVVQDFYDLTRLLAEHPEWRAQLRQLVLNDELLSLPQIVRELAQAQQRTEQRVADLAQAQQRMEAQLETLTARLDALTARVDELTAAVRELASSLHDLAEAQKQLNDRVGHMLGDLLELRYREHAAGYFGGWLRHARAVAPVTLEDALETKLIHEDMLDVLRLDLLVNGRWRAAQETPEVWLAVEVAAVLNEGDVARAWRRATLLRQAGYRAVPLVAGEEITPDGETSARLQKVGIVRDGQPILPPEMLAAWVA
ncbi:MAG: hypothetical protein HY782_23870 [Chloroflexi bacterium]|nr:hypothetical protein [Chloroflexota bacterium]